MHTFHSEQWLPLPVELVFAFFANPANLPRLMPAWQHARIEKTSIVPPSPPHPSRLIDEALRLSTPAAGDGTRLTLSFRLFPFSPIRIQWEAEIKFFLWNKSFTDIQLRGPFAHWHHVHTVTPETRNGDSGVAISGTLLHDEVQYEIPLGKLGDLAHPLISRQLSRTFAYRHRRIRELLVNI